MAPTPALSAITSVFVTNLPTMVDENTLSSYFRSHLNLPTCHVTLVHSPAGEATQSSATIGLGRYEVVQEAIRELHGKEMDGKEISVSLDLSSITEHEEKKRVVSEYLLDRYERDIRPSEQLGNILDVLNNSLDLEHILEHCTRKERFRFYAHLVENALYRGEKTVQPLSVEALEVVEEFASHGDPMCMGLLDGRISTIRRNLYHEGLGGYCFDTLNAIWNRITSLYNPLPLLELYANERRFRLIIFHARVATAADEALNPPLLPDTVNDLILQLNLDKLGGFPEWKQAIHNYLLDVYTHQYSQAQLSRVSSSVCLTSSSPWALYGLLKVCCADVYRFSVYVIAAQLPGDGSNRFSYKDIPDSVAKMVRQLGLEKLNGPDEWIQALKKHMIGLYYDRYRGSQSARVLDNLRAHRFWRYVFYDLLEMCLDPYQFSLYACANNFYCECDSGEPCDCGISDPALSVARQLDLSKLGSLEGWKEALLDHLIRIHGDRYSEEQLVKFFRFMFRRAKSRCDFYNILKVCNADVYQFSVYMAFAQIALNKEEDFHYYDIPDSVTALVRQLDLGKLTTLDGFIEELLRHLAIMYGEQFSEAQVAKKLTSLFHSLVLSGYFFDMLQICTLDVYHFNTHIVSSKVNNPWQGFRIYYDFPDSVVAFVHQLRLDKMDDHDQIMEALTRHLLSEHGDRYDESQLTEIVRDHTFCSGGHDFFLLLRMFSADAYTFSVYMAAFQDRPHKDRRFHHWDIPAPVMSLVRELDLDKLNSVDGFQEALCEHLVVVHKGRYSKECLMDMSSVILNSGAYQRFYNLLEVCASDAYRLNVHIVALQLPVRDCIDFGCFNISDSVVRMVRKLDQSKLVNFEGFKEALHEHILAVHGHRYDKERLTKALDRRVDFTFTRCYFYNLLRDYAKWNRYVPASFFRGI